MLRKMKCEYRIVDPGSVSFHLNNFVWLTNSLDLYTHSFPSAWETFIAIQTLTPLHYRWNNFLEKKREDIKLDSWQLMKRRHRRRCRRTFDYSFPFDLWLMVVLIISTILFFSFFTAVQQHWEWSKIDFIMKEISNVFCLSMDQITKGKNDKNVIREWWESRTYWFRLIRFSHFL